MPKTKTLSEVHEVLKKLMDDGYGEFEFKVSIPYRDGVGLHYEEFVNVTTHSGIVDMHVTKPDLDDVEKK